MSGYRRILLEQIGINKLECDVSEWIKISDNGNLTTEFMREFEKELFWNNIYLRQKIEDDLLIEFEHLIDWTFYFLSVNSSFSIIKKYLVKCDCGYLEQVKLSHFTTQQRKEIQRIIDLKIIF
jgi:hypothetical protein